MARDRAQAPLPPPVAVLHFPHAHTRHSYDVTTPARDRIARVEAIAHGRQADVTAPDGRPLGRVVRVRRGEWHLLEPGTGAVVMVAPPGRRATLRLGGGPDLTVNRRRRRAWSLDWAGGTVLLATAVQRAPTLREEEYDVAVLDAQFTVATVVFAVHVRRARLEADRAAARSGGTATGSSGSTGSTGSTGTDGSA